MSVRLGPVLAVNRSGCVSCAVRFAWMNLGINSSLAVLKAVVGLLSGSRALLAASLYSVNDVLSAIAVIVSLRMAGRPPTKEHPFGHGKVEFIAIGVVSLMLAASVCFFVYSVFEIVHGSKEPPRTVALGVALLSTGACELLARKGFCVAERLDSPALHTSAEHNRSDAIASLAVVGGLIGAAFGLHVLDRLVAIYEAADVAHLSGVLLGRSIKGLMDSALPAADVELVRVACEKTPGVLGVNSIRSRRAGTAIWVDVVVAIAEGQTVEQGYQTTDKVRAVLRRALGPSVHALVGFRARPKAGPFAAEVSAHA